MENAVQARFSDYPELARQKLSELRCLILQCAQELKLGKVEESLKWGEASYKVKSGSPIRIDWKAKTPEEYYVFFNCNTKLVDTFRELYGDVLAYQGNRAIVLGLTAPLPLNTLKHCIQLALTYQQIRHLPLLGAAPTG
ncbi:DUF1801 domain-containing protein [Bowmanella denitrificans]|uniref:DUF1801 domain-containing protein n=1 Tax=Bowmanella denitrificans TaxID=366582 RepID=A0ABN0XBF6_9ALTE|nr:DUF1801 domain-containing protein [Bowmanella denitrificans]